MERIRITVAPTWDVPKEILTDFVGIEIAVNKSALNRLLLEDPHVWSRNSCGVGRAVLTKDAIDALETAGKQASARYLRSKGWKILKFENGTYEVTHD